MSNETEQKCKNCGEKIIPCIYGEDCNYARWEHSPSGHYCKPRSNNYAEPEVK